MFAKSPADSGAFHHLEPEISDIAFKTNHLCAGVDGDCGMVQDFLRQLGDEVGGAFAGRGQALELSGPAAKKR
jgi:hypothetical protein